MNDQNINTAMSAVDLNKVENDEEHKTPDKKQIEAEEKEVMLKPDNENAPELKPESEGPVKAALSGEVTEQGREVKPKFIPIGAIKMPGFFTRNSDKDKSKEEDGIEKDVGNDKTEERKPLHQRFRFLHTCPFTHFMHHPQKEKVNDESATEDNKESKRTFPMINLKNFPNVFQRAPQKDPEAALASMETLEDKVDAPNEGKADTPNDKMENVKLGEEEGMVATRLPLKERILQRKLIIDDMIVLGVVVLVVLSAIIAIIICAQAGPPAERPLRLGRYMTTITSCGKVEGIRDEGVYKFYSLPYAVPPVGDRRFTYAQALNSLTYCWNGTKSLHEPGPRCLQFLDNGDISGDEDCLTLDIVTPHVRYDSPLPVVVLIGANTLAGGISPAIPSALYARTKEIVFVRPNFRLGPAGFLALDVLSNTIYPPTSGNYGLSDLIVALDWIKLNIKHFGGDPNSVTLLGHRAGAMLVAALTTNKVAQKLYTRVWLSSPSAVYPTEPLEKAEKNNEQFKLISKCNDLECLRRMSSMELMTTVPDTWLTNNVGSLPLNGEIRHSWLVLDGNILRQPANESWLEQKKLKAEGKADAFKPIVIGTTQHSGHSDLLRMKHLNWTSGLVEEMVNKSVIGESGLSAAVFKEFNKSYEGLVEIISSVRTLCPLLNLTQSVLGTPLYVVLGAGAGGGRSGSGIAGINADVEAILGTFDSEGPEQRRFMSSMQHLFYYYTWHGEMSGPKSNLIAIGQDQLPLQDLPVCRLLIEKDLVPKYAHIN